MIVSVVGKGPDWSPGERAELVRLYPDMPTGELARRLARSHQAIYNMAWALGLAKSPAYMARAHAYRLRRARNSSKHTQFKPDNTPWNKGKHYSAGGRSPATRFKPGNRPHNWQPVGTEIIDPDGYRKRKISDKRAPARHDWAYVHVLVWEHHHGRVPADHAVVFRDGEKTNIRIENLELVSREELMRRNSVHRLPKPLAETIQLKGVLQRLINDRST